MFILLVTEELVNIQSNNRQCCYRDLAGMSDMSAVGSSFPSLLLEGDTRSAV